MKTWWTSEEKFRLIRVYYRISNGKNSHFNSKRHILKENRIFLSSIFYFISRNLWPGYRKLGCNISKYSHFSQRSIFVHFFIFPTLFVGVQPGAKAGKKGIKAFLWLGQKKNCVIYCVLLLLFELIDVHFNLSINFISIDVYNFICGLIIKHIYSCLLGAVVSISTSTSDAHELIWMHTMQLINTYWSRFIGLRTHTGPNCSLGVESPKSQNDQ